MDDFSFEASAENRGTRLDKFLSAQLPDLSRSRIQSLIKEAAFRVNGHSAKPSYEMETGDIVTGAIPEDRPSEAQAEDIPLEILHEDSHLAVINKASGMVVHPAEGNHDGTLVNALLHHFGPLSSIGGVQRPGIVHRLDKETSGCLVVARDDTTHISLTNQFAGREVEKIYLAVVHGTPAIASGTVETQIGRNPHDRQKMAVVHAPAGKHAVTDYEVLQTLGDSSLVKCTLHTGRTHQIRVHMKHLGHPLLGDTTYGRPSKQASAPRLMLHAWRLGFSHPVTSTPMKCIAPIPAEFHHWTKGVSVRK